MSVQKNIEITKYSEIELSKSMLSGSEPWNNSSNTFENTVDSDFTTYFDGIANGYVLIDLGKTYTIEGVGYAPRTGFGYRMKDGYFQGSSDGEKWTTIYTVSQIPPDKTLTTADVKRGKYRYIRYTVPSGTHKYNPSSAAAQEYCCNISEIKLYGESAE
jgi:hypothetical protein